MDRFSPEEDEVALCETLLEAAEVIPITGLGKLLWAHQDVVADSDKELGQTRTVKMRTETGGHAPIKMKPYRTPIYNRPLVEQAVKDMLESSLIPTYP